MTRVPILTEVCLRAWGLDDPRALPALRAENQPGRTTRTNAVRRRARAAGWPLANIDDQRKAATASLWRLEGVVYSQVQGHQPRIRVSYHRASRGIDEHADGISIEPVLTIFDE